MTYNFIGKLDLLFKKKNSEIKKLKGLLAEKVDMIDKYKLAYELLEYNSNKEISKLNAEIERLKEALQKIVDSPRPQNTNEDVVWIITAREMCKNALNN